MTKSLLAREFLGEFRAGAAPSMPRVRSQFNDHVLPCPAGSPERRVERQQDRRPWLLIEVEVADEIPEDGLVLPHARPRVGPTVGLRVEPGAAKEVVLDELGVG